MRQLLHNDGINIWIYESALITVFFFASLVCTGVLVKILGRLKVVDVPNMRSLHTVPTPTGAGLCIALLFYVAIAFVDFSVPSTAKDLLVYFTLPLVVMGVWDDLSELAVGSKLLFQFLAVAYLLWSFNFSSLLFSACVAFIILFFLNLYNFMDGIDGLAISQSIFVWSVLVFLSYHQPSLYWLFQVAFLLVVLLIGVLVWNWSPAKIFLGDSGSFFLGGGVVSMAVYTAIHNKISIFFWLTIVSLFVVDASMTMVLRFLNHENILKAHKSNLYQLLTSRLGSHSRVVLIYMSVNIFLVMPLALEASRWAMIVCYLLLAVCYLVVRTILNGTVTKQSAHKLKN